MHDFSSSDNWINYPPEYPCPGGAPIIGDRVLIGAGAKIIGGVHVGDDVRIGANCVVVRDIPANVTVVLSEPRIIEHSEARDNSFRTYGTMLR